MLPPLIKLEHATIVRATHTVNQDALRVQFEGSEELIVYNNSEFDSLSLSMSDPSREFPMLAGLQIETIARTEEELVFHLSGHHRIRIGLKENAACGPEAFQIALPGYPPVVEQND
jgi:hypothetical protein